MRTSIALAAGLLALSSAGARADLQILGRRSQGRDRGRAGSSHPWALAFLPDGRMLVTERPGRMRIVTPDGKLSPPLQGVPKVVARPARAACSTSRSTATSPATRRSISASPSPRRRRAHRDGARHAAATAKLDDVKVIFRQDGPLSSGNHFGCRIAQSAGQQSVPHAWASISPTATRRRTSTSHLGKIVRIKPDGSVPDDNPFVGRKDAKPEIWSYGHRNRRAPRSIPPPASSGSTSTAPRGGDEINISAAGQELRLAGDRLRRQLRRHEDRQRQAEMPGMEQPIKYWVPSIAPSGMAFYTGDLFPAWKGSLFVGALAGADAGAADARRREGDRRGAPAARPARAHPRRARRAGRRALSATDNSAGRILRSSRRSNRASALTPRQPAPPSA